MKQLVFIFIFIFTLSSNIYGDELKINKESLRAKSTDQLITIIEQSLTTYNDSLKEIDSLKKKINVQNEKIGIYQEKDKLHEDLDVIRQKTIKDLTTVLLATRGLLDNHKEANQELRELAKTIGNNADKEIKRLKQEHFWDNIEWTLRGLGGGALLVLLLL